MTKKQINLMIESLEELNEELSNQNKGTLFSEQHELLEYLKQLKAKTSTEISEEKEFEIKKLTNHAGSTHLLVVTEDAVEDVHIGSVIIVPYAEGFRDPIKVVLQVVDKGFPKTLNKKFAIVSKYIYE